MKPADAILDSICLLEHLSENLYHLWNMTREQQLLALQGVANRIKEREQTENSRLHQLMALGDSLNTSKVNGIHAKE